MNLNIVPTRNVLGLSQKEAEHMAMGLELPEHFGAVNTPLKTRKAELRITFTDHHPRLWVRTPNGEAECVAYLNTRTKQMIPLRPKHESNLLFCSHLFSALDAVDCIIALSYDVDPKTQRKRMRLQLRSQHASRIAHTLHWLWKGTESPWMDHFDYTSHPLYANN